MLFFVLKYRKNLTEILNAFILTLARKSILFHSRSRILKMSECTRICAHTRAHTYLEVRVPIRVYICKVCVNY